MTRFVYIASITLVLLILGGTETHALGESGDADNFRWLVTMMDTAYAIKPGMTVEDLLKVFEREGGGGFSRIMTKNGYEFVHTYVLQKCPVLKIDVKFEGEFSPYDPKPGSKILWVSKPYLETPILD